MACPQSADAMDTSLHKAKKGTTLSILAKDEVIAPARIDGYLGKYDLQSRLIRLTPRKAQTKRLKVNYTGAEELITTGRMRATCLAEVERAKAVG